MSDGFKKMNLGFLIGAVVIVLLLGSLVYRQWGLLVEAQEELEIQKQLMQQTQDKLQERIALAERSDEISRKMIILHQSLPEEPRENEILRKLDEFAETSGVLLSDIRFQGRIEQDSFVEMPLQLRFTGSYGGMLAFLGYIDTADRSFRVDEVRVSTAEERQLTFDVRCSVFYATD